MSVLLNKGVVRDDDDGGDGDCEMTNWSLQAELQSDSDRYTVHARRRKARRCQSGKCRIAAQTHNLYGKDRFEEALASCIPTTSLQDHSWLVLFWL